MSKKEVTTDYRIYDTLSDDRAAADGPDITTVVVECEDRVVKLPLPKGCFVLLDIKPISSGEPASDEDTEPDDASA